MADHTTSPIDGESTVQPSATAATQRMEISDDDLPLFCPMDSMSLWNSHPRVFLPIDETGEERCPYCGTLYVLRRSGTNA